MAGDKKQKVFRAAGVMRELTPGETLVNCLLM